MSGESVEAVEIRAFAVRPERTDEGFGTALGTLIPSRQRRAASPLARTIADLYSALSPSFTTALPILVTGSAYGETETAIVLIEGHLHDPSGVSPARFAASVHNTAAGLVGIATGNVAPATAIAAGAQTFAMALVEAIASVRTTGAEVAVLVAEQALPEALASSGSTPPAPVSTIGVGLLLGPASGKGLVVSYVHDATLHDASVRELPPSELAPWFPTEFVEAVAANRTGLVSLVRDGARVLAVRLGGDA